VTRVELKITEQRVEVWAGHAESARWSCPECAAELALYDHGEEKGATRILGISWDEAWDIKRRAVARGRPAAPRPRRASGWTRRRSPAATIPDAGE
jgi:hypothetical protein